MYHIRSEEGFGGGYWLQMLIMHGAGKEHKNLEGLTVIHTPRFRANMQELGLCLGAKARIWP
jgi:hypothetical protein